jgi:hypothetical protein
MLIFITFPYFVVCLRFISRVLTAAIIMNFALTNAFAVLSVVVVVVVK